jgi:diguanylate cyclase (GGDEF)-like protein/PAS domain S-box-containing protein
MEAQTLSLTPGGEFRDPALESDYRAARLPEWLRYSRLAFFWAALLNSLFFANDYLRFFGTPHFAEAVTARSGLILVSLGCLALLPRMDSFRRLHALCLAWCAAAIPACAVLLSPQTEAALLFLFVLPIIYALSFPLTFAATSVVTLLGSGLALAAHFAGKPWAARELGLVLGLVTEIAVLLLLLSRSNRLQRLEWAARQALRRANQDLDHSRHALQALFQAVPAPLLVLDRDGTVIQANAEARDFFGEAALGPAQALRRCFSPEDFARITAPAAQGRSSAFEGQVRLPDGGLRDMLLRASSVEIQGAAHCLAVCMDISQRKEMEARLALLAHTDPLTGLANRHRFFDAAAAEIKRSRRRGSPPAVLMLDLDHFKGINDSLGHEAGDAALRRVAMLCRTLLRSQDLACRLGGEEFAVLLPETGAEGALALAERMRRAVEGLRLDQDGAQLTVSVGVAVVAGEEPSVNPALARADRALYAAKRAGRNKAVLWGGEGSGN